MCLWNKEIEIILKMRKIYCKTRFFLSFHSNFFPSIANKWNENEKWKSFTEIRVNRNSFIVIRITWYYSHLVCLSIALKAEELKFKDKALNSTHQLKKYSWKYSWICNNLKILQRSFTYYVTQWRAEGGRFDTLHIKIILFSEQILLQRRGGGGDEKMAIFCVT